MTPDFSAATAHASPFPHFRAPAMLTLPLADAALAWLRDEGRWDLRIENFYEQHELSLLDAPLPANVATLTSIAFVDEVRAGIRSLLAVADELELVGVTAHRLTAGQTIRIHNDHIGMEETHRLLIQLNDGWNAERGGLLMLFSDDAPETLTDVLLPEHASGFAFEISERSHHAVSTIRSGERFTVVYTFRSRT